MDRIAASRGAIVSFRFDLVELRRRCTLRRRLAARIVIIFIIIIIVSRSSFSTEILDRADLQSYWLGVNYLPTYLFSCAIFENKNLLVIKKLCC